MKSIIKLMVVFVCVVSLVACGKKDTTVSANKDGVLYEAGVGVSFYYPSDFKSAACSLVNFLFPFLEPLSLPNSPSVP